MHSPPPVDSPKTEKHAVAPSLLAWMLVVGQLVSGAVAAQHRHLLWEVTSPAGKAWLLGSIHFGRESMYPLPDEIENAYAHSGTLAVEVNVEAVDRTAALRAFRSRGVYDDGSTLEENLSPATWARVEEAARRYDVPVKVFERQKPWLVALTLTTMELSRSGLSEAWGVDRYFLRKAAEHKPVVELESFASQMELFSGFSPREQQEFLEATLRDLETGGELFARTVTAWRDGDADAVDALMNDSFRSLADSRHLYRVLVTERNLAMTDGIEHLLQKGGTCFVVVGAAHLVGAEGIVSLLGRRGYEVVQH